MAHFTCVGATEAELRADARRAARRRHRQRPGAARRPAAGPGGVDQDRGRPGVLARAGARCSARTMTFAVGAACFPETHIHADLARGRPALPQGEGRRGSRLPHHAVVLRQPAVLRLRGSRAGGRHRRADHPGHHADHRLRPDRPDHQPCAARRCPSTCSRELEARKDDPEAVAEFGVSYATMQCADLLAHGAPGMHFYT